MKKPFLSPILTVTLQNGPIGAVLHVVSEFLTFIVWFCAVQTCFSRNGYLLKNLPATWPYGTHNMFTFEVHENRYKPWVEETLLPIDICLKILNNGLPKEKDKEREWYKKALIFIRYTLMPRKRA